VNRITETEIRDLWEEFAHSSDPDGRLRNRLAEHYLPLVAYQAKRMIRRLPASVRADDLTSAGVFGLLAAIDAFDPGRGVKFETYAPLRIRGAMLDELRSTDWVPRLVRSRCEKPIEMLSMHGRSEKRGPLGGDRRSLESAVYEDRRIAAPADSMQRADVLRMVTRGLTANERRMVQLYYCDELTMREIGAVLGLSESRVSQMHTKVLDRLRESLEGRQAEFVV
jgi:RNA polymerase sigma factor for flagellar operon FliA